MLAIALMFADKHLAQTQDLRDGLSTVTTPLQYAVNWPVEMLDKLDGLLTSRSALVKENNDLKSEQLELNAQIQRLMALQVENDQLKALLSTAKHTEGRVLVAKLLAVAAEPFVNQVILDKGSQEGVFVGQAVLDATGVMGQVIQVTPSASRVLLINDNHSGISVQNSRNGIRAIAVGDSVTGNLRLVNIAQTVDIKVGDTLVTSSFSQRYPEGYPVGNVTSVVQNPGQQFAAITVQPSAHLDRSRLVLLVWPPKKPASESSAIKMLSHYA